MEIGVGLRQRPLTKVELNAKETVALYAKVAQETREMFKAMKSESFNVTKHESYEKYCKIREIRNDLAREILENYPLHREFVNQISREFFEKGHGKTLLHTARLSGASERLPR